MKSRANWNIQCSSLKFLAKVLPMFSYPFPYGIKLIDFLSPHSSVLILKETTSSVSMKINKSWSLQSAIVWVLGWQVACMLGKREHKVPLPLVKNHVKITWKCLLLLYLVEIRCSQKLKLNQQPMHFSSTWIHTLSHTVLRENRCGKQSIFFTTGDKVLSKVQV